MVFLNCVQANRRKEIVDSILEKTREKQEKKTVGSFSKDNLRKVRYIQKKKKRKELLCVLFLIDNQANENKS